jgi:hypothetical protein
MIHSILADICSILNLSALRHHPGCMRYVHLVNCNEFGSVHLSLVWSSSVLWSLSKYWNTRVPVWALPQFIECWTFVIHFIPLSLPQASSEACNNSVVDGMCLQDGCSEDAEYIKTARSTQAPESFKRFWHLVFVNVFSTFLLAYRAVQLSSSNQMSKQVQTTQIPMLFWTNLLQGEPRCGCVPELMIVQISNHLTPRHHLFDSGQSYGLLCVFVFWVSAERLHRTSITAVNQAPLSLPPSFRCSLALTRTDVQFNGMLNIGESPLLRTFLLSISLSLSPCWFRLLSYTKLYCGVQRSDQRRMVYHATHYWADIVSLLGGITLSHLPWLFYPHQLPFFLVTRNAWNEPTYIERKHSHFPKGYVAVLISSSPASATFHEFLRLRGFNVAQKHQYFDYLSQRSGVFRPQFWPGN